jgi:hypothetical protein
MATAQEIVMVFDKIGRRSSVDVGYKACVPGFSWIGGTLEFIRAHISTVCGIKWMPGGFTPPRRLFVIFLRG